ncbi:siphovirus Gp157 family protein [Enterococcus ureasiticus]|uniref:siphovirus Gp157 family protein n=1 Tax=Enterococcus ureasiticus TaxID=903984 RepID=UPI001A8D5F3C|nr:siphovirus Gp157 family protein [Enterococcus ureasiticus]MBO0473275.1 siphovirus Gp157 family protein [Enterococcus ureasiticus]
MKLYEMTENYNQVLEMAEQLDAETLKDTLDSIDEAIEIKVENTAKVVRSLEGNVDAIDSEIKRLTAKKSTLNNNIKGIKNYMQESMEQVGKDKIKGQLFNVGIQNNQQSVNVLDEKKINLNYFIEQPPKLDKKLLLADLKEGKEVEGAEIQQTRSLRIR